MLSIVPPDETPLKRCPNCPQENQWHPATVEIFGRDRNQKDGLNRICKACKAAYYNSYFERPDRRERLRSSQAISKATPEARERQRLWRIEYSQRPEVQERQRAYTKEYYRRPEVRDRQNKWQNHWKAMRMQDPTYRESMRTYYASEKIRNQKKAYRQSEHALKVHCANSHRRRARKQLVIGSYTAAQIQEQLKRQQFRCYYAACGYSRFERVDCKYVYHIEHTYPISRAVGTDIPANDISFIVLACPSCNQSKKDKLPHEWPEGGRLF